GWQPPTSSVAPASSNINHAGDRLNSRCESSLATDPDKGIESSVEPAPNGRCIVKRIGVDLRKCRRGWRQRRLRLRKSTRLVCQAASGKTYSDPPISFTI